MEFSIESLNISEKKGTVKHPVREIILNDSGVLSDAHSGLWHRQVSLLAIEQITSFSRKYNKEFLPGDFAENITTSGIDFRIVKVLDIIENDSVKLMITQKGKKCHGGGCAIFVTVGQCVMPKEGVFARVISKGRLTVGDKLNHTPKVFRIAVVTLSDRASKREYEDLSGPAIGSILNDFFKGLDRKFEIQYHILPDNADMLTDFTRSILGDHDIMITTGGTGMSEKDITIETISPMLDKQIPGLTEMIRIKYGMENPKALLSRSIAGSIGKMLVFCLPGSPKAVQEYMAEIVKVLEHTIYMLHGLDGH
ncbi:MAG: molybdenum cofactor synthesis domain-containing protein [Deltaproteobacteria bacterium]